MSSYYRFTKHPKTNIWENALWLDDYFERYHYGVEFSDKIVYDPWEIPLQTEINEEEAKILNNELQKETKRLL